MPPFEIKHRYTGSVLFSLDCGSLKLCVEAAVKNSADLSSANLRFANLRSANLSFADLRYANLRSANLSFADLRYANLSFANLRYANLSFADLRYANLSFANLSFADLSSANLSFADLRYAKWPLNAVVLQPPVIISGLLWHVMLFGSHLRIGCECHSVSDWVDFEDSRISAMDSRAIGWWQKNKARILAFRDLEAERQFAEKQATPEEPVTA